MLEKDNFIEKLYIVFPCHIKKRFFVLTLFVSTLLNTNLRDFFCIQRNNEHISRRMGNTIKINMKFHSIECNCFNE